MQAEIDSFFKLGHKAEDKLVQAEIDSFFKLGHKAEDKLVQAEKIAFSSWGTRLKTSFCKLSISFVTGCALQ